MAVEDGFNLKELDSFQKKLLQKAQKEFPRETYQFLRKAGTKGRTCVARKARKLVKKDTGNYQKGWKRGKAYKRRGEGSYEVQIRNSAPHAHLIEYGHVQVSGGKKGKGGKEVGYTHGKHVLEKGIKEFESQYFDMLENWLDEMMEKGL
ncbi:HK97 gp10 family phage protein [Marinisporobacter balticus]|uniref:Bacteriophage HK97-gp10 putative tail-component n=1 Tax=Marinisporobacter balticus TaxID=2018667 RepID=A0A4R2K9S8_9FIRM|nr:HK97 gp10 family phage protein [Marinisporobacter balticus]TCO69504.1 bacteriophage HK97-gp10 putative tail-component [Marinisporobacter balticus]